MLGSVPWETPSVQVIRRGRAKCSGKRREPGLQPPEIRANLYLGDSAPERLASPHALAQCPCSMRRSVFFAARGEQDRCDKDHDDDGDDKKRGSNVHGADSLLLPD